MRVPGGVSKLVFNNWLVTWQNEPHSMASILHQSRDNVVSQTGTGEIKCPIFKNFQYIWQIKDANIDRKIFLILPFMETT